MTNAKQAEIVATPDSTGSLITAPEERGVSALAQVAAAGMPANRAETAVSAVTERERAMVQASILQAISRPRNFDQCRQRLLADCERIAFARLVEYEVPFGETKARGVTIRFAEAAARAWGNIEWNGMVVYDDDRQRIVRVTVRDLERNYVQSSDVVVTKVVERRKPRDGQLVRGSRTNSKGETVFLVEPAENELAAKQNALVSRALRNLLIKEIPVDLVDEAREVARKRREKAAAADPDEARNSVVDGFARLGIEVAALEEYLGHAVATTTPKEVEDLRGVWQALNDGDAKWSDVLDKVREDREAKAAKKAKSDKPKSADLPKSHPDAAPPEGT